jgi:hypothetical protein
MADGRVYQASLLADVGLDAAPTGNVYEAFLSLPTSAPPLRARVYRASLALPAAGGGLKARVYQAGMVLPLPAGRTPPSGVWIARGGNVQPCVLRAAANGTV